MNSKSSVAILSDHQPISPDQLLTQNLINKYDDVRRFLLISQLKRPYPIYGILWVWGWLGSISLILKYFYKCDSDDVIMSISNIIENPLITKGVRY